MTPALSPGQHWTAPKVQSRHVTAVSAANGGTVSYRLGGEGGVITTPAKAFAAWIAKNKAAVVK